MQIYFLGGDTPSTQKRWVSALLRGKACTHAVRLAKIAQYIAIFRLIAVAPYLKPPFPPALLRGCLPLRTPEEESFEPTPLPSSIADERKGSGGFQRAPTDAGTFAVAKVRLAKIAQFIAIFRLKPSLPI